VNSTSLSAFINVKFVSSLLLIKLLASEKFFSHAGTLTLNNLSSELETVVHWYTLGIKLEVEYHKLREIEERYHDLQRRKCEVLTSWLCKGHNCTWKRVVEVLIQMGEMVVADAIKLKYLTLTTGRS